MIHGHARAETHEWERATLVMLGLALLVVGVFMAG